MWVLLHYNALDVTQTKHKHDKLTGLKPLNFKLAANLSPFTTVAIPFGCTNLMFQVSTSLAQVLFLVCFLTQKIILPGLRTQKQ